MRADEQTGAPGICEDLDRATWPFPACSARRGGREGLFGLVSDPGYQRPEQEEEHQEPEEGGIGV